MSGHSTSAEVFEPDLERARNGHLARVSCVSVLTATRGRSAPMLVNIRHLTIPDTFQIRLLKPPLENGNDIAGLDHRLAAHFSFDRVRP